MCEFLAFTPDHVRTSWGSGRIDDEAPRFSTLTSCPCSTARATHAELMTPLPPMKRMRLPVIAPA